MKLKNLFKKALRKIHRPAHPDIFKDFAEELKSLKAGKFRYAILRSPSPELNGNFAMSPAENSHHEILVRLKEDFDTGITRYIYTDLRAFPPATQEFAATDKEDLARLHKLLGDYITEVQQSKTAPKTPRIKPKP